MHARETCFAALVRSRNRRDGRASTGAGFAGAHDERAHGRSAPQGLGGNVACKSHSLPGQVEPRTLPPRPAPPLRALTAAPKPRLLAMPISRLAGLTPSLPPSRPPPSEARLFLDGTGAPLSWRNVWLVPSSKPAESRSAQLATSADALPSLAPSFTRPTRGACARLPRAQRDWRGLPACCRCAGASGLAGVPDQTCCKDSVLSALRQAHCAVREAVWAPLSCVCLLRTLRSRR